MIKKIKTKDAPQAIGPYSQAVQAGEFVFVSGQIALDPETGTVLHSSIQEETRLVIENSKKILLAADCDLKNVVKVSIFLKNMSDFGAVNEIYRGYFDEILPARSTIEVSRLPRDVSIEMDFIALKGKASR